MLNIKLNNKLSLHLVSSFINFFTSLLGIIILTNNYTTQEFGKFALAQVIFLICYSISFSNYHFYLNKKIIEDHKNEQNYLLDSFVITFFFSCIVYLLLINLLPFFIDDVQILKLVKIIALPLILQPMAITYYSFFIGQKFGKIFLITLISSMLSITLKLFVAFGKYDIETYAYTYVFDIILIIFLLNLLYFLKVDKIKINFSLNRIIQNLKIISLLPLLGFFAVINLRIDLIMVSNILGDNNASIYSVSSRLVIIQITVFFILLKYVYPKLVEDFKNSQMKKFYELYNGLISLIFFKTIFLVLIMFFYGNYILKIFGDSYLVSHNLLVILTSSIFFICLNELWVNKEYVFLKTKKIFFFYFLNIIFNIILNYFLISLYKEVGAGISTLIASILSFLIVNINNRNNFYFLISSVFSLQILSNIRHVIKRLL